MSLSPRTRLGTYEVVSAIGAGGMGEVFRARDTTLNRDIAIKVLPAGLAADAERLARFKREAQLLASLSHSNIAHVYGFEAATLPDGSTAHFLAMELVEGEDLGERLKRGAIPVDEAIAIARQIAEGLEEAHEHGIIHRDLKPANIKVTPDGKVKVLDFGLAKALDSDSASQTGSQLSHSPTMSRHATEAGMIMGTAAYMSPEQARGKPVDVRTDIWAFGVVLFEMLSGRRLFAAETVSDTLAAVLREDIPWARLPLETPTTVAHTLRRCLTRDPRQRLRSVADARILLDEGLLSSAGGEGEAVTTRGSASWSKTAILSFVSGAIITGVAFWGLGQRGSPPEIAHFRAVTSFAGVQAQPALSPDGRSVAFVSNRDGSYDIYVGLVTGGTLIKITHDPNLKSRPAWSPDGASITYARLNESGLWDIWQAPALGGTPRRLILNAADPAWSRDGRFLAYADAATRAIWVSDPAGQNPRPLTASAPDLGEAKFYGLHDAEPRFSPDGRELAFVSRAGGPYGEVNVVDIASGAVRQLTHDEALALSPSWSADGRQIYFASSRSGTMNIWRIPAQGGEPEQITSGQGDDVQPDVSPDGRSLVFATYRERLGFAQLDLSAKPGSPNIMRLTIDAARNQVGPSYSPDGSRVAYFSNLKGVEREGIWVVGADGTNPLPLVQDGLVNIFPRWSPDGEHFVYKTEPAGLGARGELRSVSVSGGAPVTLVRTAFDGNFDVGPDGRLLFRTPEGGIGFYDPKDGTSGNLSVSDFSRKGWLLRWSPDGGSIAYTIQPTREGDGATGLWVEDLQGKPRKVFSGWVTWYSRGPSSRIFVLEGKPDLSGVLWAVGWDGKGLTRLSTVPLVYSYWAGAKGLAQNYIDVSPSGPRVAFGSLEVQQANIGFLENPGAR